MARTKQHFVQSLARGLSVLQAFTPEQPALTLTQLSERTGLNVVAVQRYTDTLMELGFLKRNRHREFYLSTQVLSLGYSMLSGNQIRRLAASYISEFSDRVGKTVNLSVLDGSDIIFIFRKEVHRFLPFDLRVGSKLPAHCTGSGKVLLAGLEDEKLRQVVYSTRWEKVTEYTIVDPDKLWDDLMLTRERGYSIADREWFMDLCSLGLPLINHNGQVEAAVNLSLTVAEAASDDFESFLAQFIELGRTLCTALGYMNQYPKIPHSSKPQGEGI
ncbi:MAG: IclR family transcriptional regulator C-terminal domain-containing protein [Desulfarculaceae bacterium]